MGAFSTPRRILAAWFPWWPVERLAWRFPEARTRPFVTVGEQRGRLVIEAVNPAAVEAGLAPGMPLADGRAIVPDVIVHDADFAGDARALRRLARWADGFTPRVMPAGEDALFLDVGGCSHLFGGEEALLAALAAGLERLGLTSRLALAGTPGAAWALARHGGKSPAVVPRSAGPDEVKEALAGLPIAALRLEADVVEALVSFGLDRVGTLYPFGSGTLGKRFGPAPRRRLEQALGFVEEPVIPLPPPLPREARRAFAEPIAALDGIRAAVDALLDDLCRNLSRAGEGVRRMRLVCHRADGGSSALAIGTSRPLRRRKLLMNLLSEKLERIDPGFGIEEMVLSADVVEVVEEEQEDWFAQRGTAAARSGGWAVGNVEPGRGEELAGLLDRLGNRFGFGSIACPVPRQSWLPERAVQLREPLSAPRTPGPGWPEGRHRPLRLLSPPERVETVAREPGGAELAGAPVLFRWRGRRHRLRAAEGPERLECEWWLEDAPSRDYYLTEDEEGRRYWLYREQPLDPAAPPRWFVHGFFA